MYKMAQKVNHFEFVLNLIENLSTKRRWGYIFPSNLSVEEAPEYYHLVLNIQCLTHFVTLSVTAFGAAIWVR